MDKQFQIPNSDTESLLRHLASSHSDRKAFWQEFINLTSISMVAEIGVYRGIFAEALLNGCPRIHKYYMIDPWRNLSDWNKPANKSDEQFETIFSEAKERTSPWGSKVEILRGRTEEVIDTIEDETLDFAYIDGDHTLQGITIDLVNAYRKIPPGGFLAGDDFTSSIWQHRQDYEPTFVFPFAVHFAKAVGAAIYSLPSNQFLIEKRNKRQYAFLDVAGGYGDLSVRTQALNPRRLREILRFLRGRLRKK